MKPSTRRRAPAKRGLLSTARASERHAVIKEDYAAIDQFGELPGRKREAMRIAHDAQHAHRMGAWHVRPNDAYGRWNAFCLDCGAAAVVCTEAPPNLDLTYGTAVAGVRCASGQDEEAFV